MAERLYIWIATGPEASHPSKWEVVWRIPLTLPPGEEVEGDVFTPLDFSDPNFYPVGDNEFTFIAWIQEHAPGSLFEMRYYDPGKGKDIEYTCGWLLIPDDNDAFAARMRWPFLKVAKW